MASVVAVTLLTLLLAGCETTGIAGRSATSAESRAERHAQSGEHDTAAGIYIGLAADAYGIDRERLTLLAVEQWLDAGDPVRARNALGSVPRPTDNELLWLWNTNTAALQLFAGDPDAALEILEPMSRESLTERHRLRVDALRADAWIQKRDPLRAVELRTQRELWINDPRGIRQNRHRLWQGLLVLQPGMLRESARLALDPQARGWLELGALATSTGQQGIGWISGINRWRDTYGNHPALTIVDEYEISADTLTAYPHRIALLLPLSGRTAPAGQAIQNGFMGAYFSTAAALDDNQLIRIYDVITEGGASAAYSTAVAEGAEFVIGPLLRNNVNELANDVLVPVPVLTLNYLPEDTLAPPGLYQFALAPEDEARSAAARAIADGHRRAVALVPNNEWGRRLLGSFTGEFEAQGGMLLDYRSYTPDARDFSPTIEDLMALSGSVRRYQRLRSNIGGPLQFDPRRRQDVDLIFLAADAAVGRLINAQLKFHYSGDLAVYSTSSIYAMDGASNADLNGISFADAPWVIAPPAWLAELPAIYSEYFPEERRLGRLHAMGFDAYHLIAALYAARTGPMQELNGATGTLYLDADGRVHRRLAWAEFRGGEPVALPEIQATDPPATDLEFGDPTTGIPVDDLDEF